jgi:hypothetical protein
MATGGLKTGGYARATVMPDPGLLDPRLLATDYGAITRGLGQGLELANTYAHQRQLALDRSDANSLRELRLAAQRGQLELEPQLQQDKAIVSRRAALQAQYAPIELEATQNVSPRNRYGAPTQGFTPSTSQADAEAGILGEYSVTQNKLPGQDIVLQEERIVLDPSTGERRTVRSANKVLQTQEQIDAARALSDYRATQAQTAAEIADLRKKLAEEEAKRTGRKLDQTDRGLDLREKALSQGLVGADLVFDRRNAQNLADVDQYLRLGSVDRINDFALTPQGQGILDKIMQAKALQVPPTLSPEEITSINTFRTQKKTAAVTDMANQPPAAGSLPSAAAATLPAASSVREATQPTPIKPGTIVRQNGVSYRFDGTNYIPVP